MKDDLLTAVTKIHSHCFSGEVNALSSEEIASLLPRFSLQAMKELNEKFSPKSISFEVKKGDDFQFIRKGEKNCKLRLSDEERKMHQEGFEKFKPPLEYEDLLL